MPQEKCPFTGQVCNNQPSSIPWSGEVVPSSAGEGVIGIRSKGGRIALADLTKATAGCTGEVIEPEIGTSVSVGYDQLGVARKLGPTATTPCFKLAPFMQ